MFEHGAECTFIQIGAYDGISTDPLRKYIERCPWRGVMLEPQPGPAQKLRALYPPDRGIVVLEAALDGKRGTRSLYTVDSDQVPPWAGGMASFDRAHLLRHDYLVRGIEKMVRELVVECITFDDVIARLPEPKVDLLQIDAEGADGFILSLFPLDRIKPAIVHWEIKNMTRTSQEAALDLLCSRGYRISRSGGEDMLAVRPPPRLECPEDLLGDGSPNRGYQASHAINGFLAKKESAEAE
jgi:FkbM family methyltransferase